MDAKLCLPLLIIILETITVQGTRQVKEENSVNVKRYPGKCSFSLEGTFIHLYLSIYELPCSGPCSRNTKKTATARRTSLHRADEQNYSF